MVTREAIAVPDSTEPALSLLRELRRGHTKKQAASVAYWVYLAALVVAFYGGAQIASAFHGLRHPPLPTAQTPRILHAVPAAGLVALGLGGRSAGHVLRLAGAAMASTALLFGLAVGGAGLIERYPASCRWLRRATPIALAVVVALAGLAAWAALGRPSGVLAAIALWSGPWGWAVQGMVA